MRPIEPATITIAPRFRGPAKSGNGGYACGRVAAFVDGTAEVTLRRPPPLGRALAVERSGDAVRVRDREDLVAEATAGVVDLVPPPVTLSEALAAGEQFVFPEHHPFRGCFVCGPDRDPGDGLRLRPAPVPGRDLVVAVWVPDASLADDGRVRPEFVWAALDCPGGWATGFPGRGDAVLGRLAAHVRERPEVGERCVVVGWELGRSGRKSEAGTALAAEDGRVLAVARATWIVPRDT
jgi:hypothetical protein